MTDFFASIPDTLDTAPTMLDTAINAPKRPITERELPGKSLYRETCHKCQGRGTYRSFGPCFACKGKGGKTFKTSPQARQDNRARAGERIARQRADNWESFVQSNAPLAKWIVEKAPSFSFASSMREAVEKFGSLTGPQIEAIGRCMQKDAMREIERTKRIADAPVVEAAGVDRLKLAFDTAIARAAAKGRGFRNPRITIGGVVISPAKAGSRNEGALYVKTGSTYLGKIAKGQFFAARECTPEQEKRVVAFVQDPKAAAIAYGQETGVCCVCNAALTNKTSIEQGIGPICATKFGW